MIDATPKQQSVVVPAALAVLLERAGGVLEFTQSEFAAIMARRGRYVITSIVDRSGPGEPVIRMEIEAAPAKPGDLVM